MRAWIISDTHFGVKNNNKQWEEILCEYFDNFLFPLIEKNLRKDDILIHCGDVFDNRSTIGLSTMNLAIRVFEWFSKKMFHTYVICGNHDIEKRSNNNVTSLDCLKHIKNVTVVKDPLKIDIDDKRIGFVPWIEDNSAFIDGMRSIGNLDYMFCHAEVRGAQLNSSNTKSSNGISDDELFTVDKIFSGHIHHRGNHKNVTYVGSAVPLTYNDINNIKGVHLIDFDTDEVLFMKNTLSPSFLRLNYDDIKNKTLGGLKKICKNNFVTILFGADDIQKLNINFLLSKIDSVREILVKTVDVDEHINIIDSVTNDNMSMEEIFNSYIDTVLDYDEVTKKNIKIIINRLING